jgi:signal peptidase II
MTASFQPRPAAQISLIALLVLALDQLSKYWLVERIGMATRPPLVVTDFFSLVMVWNHGVSFGMFSHASAFMPYVLIALAVMISGLMLRMALKSPSAWERLGYALVIGGALSNALDRVRVGAVADFFYFHVGNLGYPAFNVADSCICVGVGLLVIYLLKHPARA